MKNKIKKIILTEEQIRKRVGELVREINDDFRGKDLVIVALLKGSIVFLADLVRGFDREISFDFIGVKSYGDSTQPSDNIVLDKELSIDIRDRNVLLIDDILDTGKTAKWILKYLKKFSPRQVKLCVLLNKQSRRRVDIQPDYCGFDVGDEFIVGYGLDYADRYRNLPYIAVLSSSEYKK